MATFASEPEHAWAPDRAFRSKLLIYPRFQLTLISVNVLVMGLVLAFVWLQTSRSFRELQAMGVQAGLSPEHAYFKFLKFQSAYLNSYLLIGLIAGIAVSAIFSLFLSQRLAGPIVRPWFGASLQEVTTFPVNGSRQQQAVVASLQIFEDRGQPAGALLTLRDFETLQRLETQLDFATKLAALNRITAGVAHEVKNPLHAMVLHLELLSAKLDAGLDPKPHVDILMSEVNRRGVPPEAGTSQ